MVGTSSGLGGFMSGVSIRFSKYKGGTGGADAWRDSLAQAYQRGNTSDRPKTMGMELPRVNSIHQATVVCTKEFGAFMQLGKGDKYKDGMMHVSHMGESRFERPEDAGVKLGTKLWVKVLEVKEDDMKYSLDMRYVDQRDGKDLDPYNTRGRLPNNSWEGGRVKPAAPSGAQLFTGSSAATGSAATPKEADLDGEDDDDSLSDLTSSDSEEVKEATKKMKKANKKLKKAKKKAEQMAKKEAKKKKEGGGGSEDSEADKKLKKAQKKMEKATKKAEKAKRKLDKKVAKKEKKAKHGSDSS